MIPQYIIENYQTYDNPYRKLYLQGNSFVACDFSDLIPSWKMESSEDFNLDLIKQAIEYAEARDYYSFYTVIQQAVFDELSQKLQNIGYVYYVEEIILKNQKSVNLLFWDWLYDTTNKEIDTLVVKWILPQASRR